MDLPTSSIARRRMIRAEPWLVAGAAAFVTLPRVMTTLPWGDSAEFISAAYVLGIPHPSGYPLYTMLAHLFTWLPFGSIAWRVNLFSAVCWIVAAGLATRLARRLAEQMGLTVRWSPAVVGLLLALLPTLSSQAWIAEVYTLYVLLVLLVVWAALRFAERPAWKEALVLGLCLSLAVGHHAMAALVVPSLAWLVLAKVGRRALLPRNFAAFIIGAALGLLPILYLYLRGRAEPAICWGDLSTWAGVWDHLTLGEYRRRAATLAAWPQTNSLSELLSQLRAEQGWLLLLSSTGIVLLARRIHALGALALALLLAGFFFHQQGTADAPVFLSPFVLVVLAVAAVGIAWLEDGLLARGRTRGAATLVLLLLAYAAGKYALFVPMYPTDDSAERYSRTVLDAVPDGAVLLTCLRYQTADNEYGTLRYQQVVNARGRGVLIIPTNFLVEPWYVERLRKAGVEYRGKAEFQVVPTDAIYDRLLALQLVEPLLATRHVYSTIAPIADLPFRTVLIPQRLPHEDGDYLLTRFIPHVQLYQILPLGTKP